MNNPDSEYLDLLCQRQSLEVISELTSGLAHELNNAMSVLWGNAELLRECLEEMTEGDDLSELRKQANTIHSWTATSLAVGKRLYAFSRRQREPPGTVDVNELVGECLDLCRYRCQRQQILLIADLHPEPAKVEVRPGLVQQAIINLILNAREALHRAGEEGSIRVGTEVVGAKVQVVVEDDGPGVEAGQAEAIFEAGVTVKGEGDAGWGLTVARHIARRHGGDLRRIPADGGHFVLELPTAA